MPRHGAPNTPLRRACSVVDDRSLVLNSECEIPGDLAEHHRAQPLAHKDEVVGDRHRPLVEGDGVPFQSEYIVAKVAAVHEGVLRHYERNLSRMRDCRSGVPDLRVLGVADVNRRQIRKPSCDLKVFGKGLNCRLRLGSQRRGGWPIWRLTRTENDRVEPTPDLRKATQVGADFRSQPCCVL